MNAMKKKITLSQDLTGAYHLHIFANNQKLGQMPVGHNEDEAKEKAKQIIDVCANGEFDDQTG